MRNGKTNLSKFAFRFPNVNCVSSFRLGVEFPDSTMDDFRPLRTILTMTLRWIALNVGIPMVFAVGPPAADNKKWRFHAPHDLGGGGR
jgi:hypothetical protein